MARGIIQRHNQILPVLRIRQLAMRRAVLNSNIPGRVPLALLAFLASWRRLAHRSSRLQRQQGDRVAKLVVVVPDQRLVKVSA
jgi:hypothetical protein